MGHACSQVMSPTCTHYFCANLPTRLAPVDGASAGSSTPRWSRFSEIFRQKAIGVYPPGCGADICCRMLEATAELLIQGDESDSSQREVIPPVRATGYADRIDVPEKFGQMVGSRDEDHVIMVCGGVAHVFLTSLVAMPVGSISSGWTTASSAEDDTNTICESRCRLILAGDWMDAHGADPGQGGPQTVVWYGLDGCTESSNGSLEAQVLWRVLADMWINGDVVTLHREDLLMAVAQWNALGALRFGKGAGDVITMTGTGQEPAEVWCSGSSVYRGSPFVHSAAVARGSSEPSFRKTVEYSIGGELKGGLYKEHSVSRTFDSPHSVVPSEPLNPEASVSVSSLEPPDIPRVPKPDEVSAKHVVGLIEFQLGFRPPSPSVGGSMSSLLAPPRDLTASLEACEARTGTPSIEGGLITHPAAQACAGLVAASSTVHQDPPIEADKCRYEVSNGVSGLNPNGVFEISHVGVIFEEGLKGHNSRGEAMVPANPVLSTVEDEVDESPTALLTSVLRISDRV